MYDVLETRFFSLTDQLTICTKGLRILFELRQKYPRDYDYTKAVDVALNRYKMLLDELDIVVYGMNNAT